MPASLQHPVTTNSIFYPLSEFYEELELSLPEITRLAPAEVPEPFCSLLVHDRDMTPTLEAAHDGKLGLRLLRFARQDDVVNRIVALVLSRDGRTVGMGAIRIFLEHLPPAAKDSVLEGHEPFGAILRQSAVTHCSRPVAYFRVKADSLIAGALGTELFHALYGRRNTIWNSFGQPLAEVVEILPPSGDPRGV